MNSDLKYRLSLSLLRGVAIRAILMMLVAFGSTGFAQKKVILDTDPSFDPDDVGCMAMLHALASRGECEILAVMNSMNHQESSLSISAINTFYNRGAIPIGDYKAYGEFIRSGDDLYTYLLAETYPRKLDSYEQAEDSVALYREILASAEAKSITVIVIGTMHNFYGLLQSGSCQFSALSGVELVREKVALVATMGGNFINGKGLDRTNWGGADALCGYTSWSCLNEERNRMCRYVIENCPAPFMASGWEVGCGNYHDAGRGNVMTGQELKKLPERHIARRSYEHHFATRGGSEKIDRHSNDQCALHFAVLGEGENYRAFTNGDIDLSPSGECSWSASRNLRQGYIEKKRAPEAIAAEIEALMMEDAPALDLTAPMAPSGLKAEFTGDRVRLTWNPAVDRTPGSWVVGYRVYRDRELVGTAYGLQFLDARNDRGGETYEVKAMNAAGALSEPAQIEIAR